MRNILSFISNSYFIIINSKSFYKEKKIYNLLFCIFFSVELLRLIFLEKYLTDTINSVTMFIEAGIFIIAIVLFCENKFKTYKN
ncbi:hypothetical protein [Clostridium tetani]|uniref:hypothetical protein n=1 Tax=Clostridium tetani TaxID=1513 RepID=UPI001026B5A5|nr:hypothetical protein [Clostridium tetani]RXI70669.1 hypothetical protein DP127_08485 [Clostridium tetani]BDR84434.1 hypothetical protein K254310026_18450 [Clostridium tetani]